jgi:hypothetical protein
VHRSEWPVLAKNAALQWRDSLSWLARNVLVPPIWGHLSQTLKQQAHVWLTANSGLQHDYRLGKEAVGRSYFLRTTTSPKVVQSFVGV